MSILVTGGCGFIGANFALALLAKNTQHVICLDKLTYAANDHALELLFEHENFSFHEIDIADQSAVAEIVMNAKPDYIINFAAESHVDNSIEKPDVCFKTNLSGVLSLLKAATMLFDTLDDQEQSRFRFHQISTDEVFGDLELDAPASNLDSDFNPSSPYSASKAAAELLVKAWSRTYGLPYIISNCTNNYGKFQHEEKLIPKVILNALAGEQIPIFNKGKEIRDWIHVDDHVAGLLSLLEQRPRNKAYFFGGNNQTQNIDLVSLILNCLSKELGVNSNQLTDLVEFVADRPGHDRRYDLDYSVSTRDLGWMPKIELEAGVYRTVKQYLSTTKRRAHVANPIK